MLPLILLLILPSIYCDRVAEHVRKYLNSSISPCDDFRRHLCAGNRWEYPEVETYASVIRESIFDSDDPIMEDIFRHQNDDSFDESVYKRLLQERCNDSVQCYTDEMRYFFNIYNWTISSNLFTTPSMNSSVINERLLYFVQSTTRMAEDIPRLISVTTEMTRVLHARLNRYSGMEMAKMHYFTLLWHVTHMAEAQERHLPNKTVTGRLNKLVNELRKEIGEVFKETPWLQETNEFGLAHQSRMLSELERIYVSFQFDNMEKSLAYWKQLFRTMTAKYYEYSKRTTGSKRLDVIHALHSVNLEMERKPKTPEEQSLYYRAFYRDNFFYEGSHNFNYVNFNTYYPTFDRTSSQTSIYAISGNIARRMLLRFVKASFTNDSRTFLNGMDCYANYYAATRGNLTWPGVADERPCSGCEGKFERYYDHAADIEGLRIAFRLMKKSFGAEHLKDLEYPNLNITKEQAFFYSFGFPSCMVNDNALNSIVSQMSEFSEAFGCKPKDREYAKPDKKCRLFGKDV